VDVVRYLIERGADVNAKNTRGQTPLDAGKASRKDRTDIVAFLSRP
jgi:ankyrin repeat protein